MPEAITIDQLSGVELTQTKSTEASLTAIVAVAFATLAVAVSMTAFGFCAAQTGAKYGIEAIMPTEKLVYGGVGILALYALPVFHAATQEHIVKMLSSAAPMFFVFGALLFTYTRSYGM